MAAAINLTTLSKEVCNTMDGATKAIEALIEQRDNALAAADPEAVHEYTQTVLTETTAVGAQAEIEASRQALSNAIQSAGAAPKVKAKPAPAPAKTATTTTETTAGAPKTSKAGG